MLFFFSEVIYIEIHRLFKRQKVCENSENKIKWDVRREETMKALIQRVMNAKVTVNGEVISTIDQGLCILIGISNNDTIKDIEYIVRKILNIKLYDDENHQKWRKSVVEKQFEVLCVSQFTLYNTWKGNRPDFHLAMPGEKSKDFYEKFIQKLKETYLSDKIKDGQFGAYMQVHIQNDGPVTFEIESPTLVTKEKTKKQTLNSNKDSQSDEKQEKEELLE